MKIEFSQIYSEPGASFALPGPFLGAVIDALDALGKNIEQFSSKFAGADFQLVFIISARHNADALEVKGPNTRRKAREVEFSLFIPWRETSSFVERIGYVLPYIGKGIIGVFERYGVDPDGIETAIRDVLEQVKADPEKFQYKVN